MKRRDLLVGGVSATVGATLAGCGERSTEPQSKPEPEPEPEPKRAPPAPRAAATRPNVLMIVIDDLKPWIGPHGYDAAHTPALDELSRRGVVFRRAYCAAPACSPSRAAVWTGRAPYQSGVYFNTDNWRDKIPDTITLPRLLRDSGYFTAGFGKLFHGRSHDDRKAWDRRKGHDLMHPSGAPFSVPKEIWRSSGSRFDWKPLDIPVERMDDHAQVDRAIAVMNEPRSEPWFVACGVFRPHVPWYVPRQFFDLHPLEDIVVPEVPEDDLDDVPKRGRAFASRGGEHKVIVENGLWQSAVQAYLASIAYADFEVGRLLEKTPEDTVIILWSDHGWHLGPKNHWHKYTLWEEASQCVFAMAGAGVAEGKQCPRTVSLNDVYPTLCELCDVSPPHELVGRSVLGLAGDPDAAWDRPAVTTWGPNNHGIRNERYRYIRYDDGGEELYDHDEDPHEWHNLAGEPSSAPIIDELAALLPARVKRKRKRRDKRKRKRTWFELPNDRRALLPS